MLIHIVFIKQINDTIRKELMFIWKRQIVNTTLMYRY